MCADDRSRNYPQPNGAASPWDQLVSKNWSAGDFKRPAPSPWYDTTRKGQPSARAPITSSQFNIFHCPAKLSSLLYRYCSAILNASSVYKLQNLFPGVPDLRQVHEPWFLHMWNSKQHLHYRVSMRIKWKTTCKALSVMPSSYNIQ